MNTPNPAASRELLEAETRIIESLRFARSGTAAPQRKGYVKELARDFLSKGRVTPVRQMLAVLRDAFDRGASEAHLLAVADQIRNEIHAWYVERDSALADFADAHVSEERAEAEADVAEAEFQRSPDHRTLQRMEHATRMHILTATAQLAAARRKLGLLS
jgi:hypothetical protein